VYDLVTLKDFQDWKNCNYFVRCVLCDDPSDQSKAKTLAFTSYLYEYFSDGDKTTHTLYIIKSPEVVERNFVDINVIWNESIIPVKVNPTITIKNLLQIAILKKKEVCSNNTAEEGVIALKMNGKYLNEADQLQNVAYRDGKIELVLIEGFRRVNVGVFGDNETCQVLQVNADIRLGLGELVDSLTSYCKNAEVDWKVLDSNLEGLESGDKQIVQDLFKKNPGLGENICQVFLLPIQRV